jgi:hypothetical protein
MSKVIDLTVGINPTFKDLKSNKALTIQARQAGIRCVVVDFEQAHYAISESRLKASSCDESQELYISKDGKWLIPADTVSESGGATW